MIQIFLSLLFTIGNFSNSIQPKISQEEKQLPLQVNGEIPTWLEGVFVRNSSIPLFENGKQVSHDFDGLAMLHGFTFHEGKVVYTNQFLDSEAYHFFKEHHAPFEGFSTSAPFWWKIKRFFISSKNLVQNASVNVFKYGENYVALTEVPLPVRFDPKTLDTLGSFEFQDNLPKSKTWESAHPHRVSQGVVNYLVDFGKDSYYVLYRINDNSSTREVISKVPVERPSYMHSFSVTSNYLILTQYPLVVNPLDLLLTSKPFIHNYKWLPERGTTFLVIDKHSGNLLSKIKTDPFFSWHHANAYENGDEIILDLVAFPDIAQMLSIFPQASLIEPKPYDWYQRLMRYRISLSKNEITPEILLDKIVEFPRIDDQLDGKKYRFLYMTLVEDSSNILLHEPETGLVKLDADEKTTRIWQKPHCRAGEPVFVPRPNRSAEDDGLILSIVNDDETQKGFLLILDAKDFSEIGRANLPWQIPSSFHGQYFSESSFKENS